MNNLLQILTTLLPLNLLWPTKAAAAASSVDNSEVWRGTGDISAGNLSSTPGTWGAIKNCPAGSFVTGYQFNVSLVLGGLSGMSLQCSQLNAKDEFEEVAVITTGSVASVDYRVKNYAVSFAFQEWVEPDESAYLGNWQIRFNDQDDYLPVPQGSNVTRYETWCPVNWAICGFHARVSTAEPVGILTRLRFKCCYYCVPEEIQMVIRDISNYGDTEMSTYVKKFMGVHVSRGNQDGGNQGESVDRGGENFSGKNKLSSTSTSTHQNEQSSLHQTEGSQANENAQQTNGDTSGGASGTRDNTNIGNSGGAGGSSSANSQSGISAALNRNSASGSGQTNNLDHRKGTSHGSNDGTNYGSGGSHNTGKSQSSGTSTGFNVGASLPGISAGMNHQMNNDRSRWEGSDRNWQGGQNFNTATNQDFGLTDSRQWQSSRNDDLGRNDAFQHNRQYGNDRNFFKNFQNHRDISFDTNNHHGRHNSNHFGRDIGRHQSLSRGFNSATDFGRQSSDQESIQAMLTARYGQSFSLGLNWGTSASSMWEDQKEEYDSFVCEAKHRCVLKQLVGKCGKVEFYTPRLIKSSTPLEGTGTQDDGTTSQVEERSENKNLETWLISTVTLTRVSDDEGFEWSPPFSCPLGSIVTQVSMTNQTNFNVTSVRLQCSKLNGAGKFVAVSTIPVGAAGGGGGGASIQRRSPLTLKSNGPVIGFSFLAYDMGKNDYFETRQFVYQDDENELPIPAGANIVVDEMRKCPDGQAICGIQTAHLHGGIIKMGLKCCLSCSPKEKLEVISSFTNYGDTAMTHDVKFTSGCHPVDGRDLEETQNGMNYCSNENAAMHLEAGFASKFGNSSALVRGFSWTQLAGQIWAGKAVTGSFSHSCPSNHFCAHKQLVGVCGGFKILTPHVIVESSPLA